MSFRTKSLRRPGGGSQIVQRVAARRTSHTLRKLDTSHRLIAPAHTLILPSLDGIQNSFEASHGFEAALPPARTLIRKGLLTEKHLEGAESPVFALEKALAEIVRNASGSDDQDVFDIEIRLTDRLDRSPESEDYLFFLWANTNEPHYIPLRPFFDQLAGNSYRERLLGSLYHWLHETASRIRFAFGFADAKCVYDWRKEMYMNAREHGEDVDVEGEVEFADPSSVMGYIRNAKMLLLKGQELETALSSIRTVEVREAFSKAHRMFTLSRGIRLPRMTTQCRVALEDAAYFIEGDPIPAVCISHWRDDAIVAWFDDYCQDQFNSGVACRPAIMLCFRTDDSRTFGRIIAALPTMVRTAAALSEWISIAEEMERAAKY